MALAYPPNTLLSSQRTTTHQQPGSVRSPVSGQPLQLTRPASRPQDTVRVFLDRESVAPLGAHPAAQAIGSYCERKPATRPIQPQGSDSRSFRPSAATRPARCRLVYLTRSASGSQLGVSPCSCSHRPTALSPGLFGPSDGAKATSLRPRGSNWPVSGRVTGVTTGAQDEGLLGLLHPGWQAPLALFLLLILLLGGHRLIQRGPSRMARSLLVIGGLILGLTVVGLLLSTR